MATVTPNPAQGQALFDGTQSFYAHDDAADNKSSGVYSHRPTEFSATEAESWCDWMRYINGLLQEGVIAVEVRNVTGSPLPAGPVRINGWNVANDRHTIGLADADANAPADLVLTAELADATNGIAYTDALVTGQDTGGSTVGDPVYLSSSGGFALTPPTGADQIQQIVGWVSVVGGGTSGAIECRLDGVKKFGTSWLQDASVTYGKLAAMTSAQFASVISDETGSGALVFATSPTLVTPAIGAATGTSFDAGTTTLYGSRAITVDTGGVLNVVLGSAAGDDFTVSTSKFLVEGDTGRVGIGTTAPDKMLEINVGAATGGVRLTYDDSNGSASTYVDMLVDSSGNLTLTPSGGTATVSGTLSTTDVVAASTGYVYFGATGTDGSWRLGRSGNDLVIQRRESGSWVTKNTITAA